MMKKFILPLLLLSASMVSADPGVLGVVSSSSGTIVMKDVFAGDVATLLASEAATTASDPSQTFQTFDLTTEVGRLGYQAIPETPAMVLYKSHANALKYFQSQQGPSDELLRAIFLVILDEFNVVRTNPTLNLAPRTMTQFRNAVQNKLNSGAAD